MSLNLYDEALKSKLTKIFPNVVGASVEEAFTASQQNGKVKLPLISFYRVSNPVDMSSYNMPEAFKGRVLSMSGYDATNGMTIPITITYQIDIWGTSRKVVDEIFSELLFYMLLKPNITLDIPKQGSLDFAMVLQDTENSTDLSDFENTGRIYRSTLTYEVSGKLFYSKSKGNQLIKEFDIKFNL